MVLIPHVGRHFTASKGIEDSFHLFFLPEMCREDKEALIQMMKTLTITFGLRKTVGSIEEDINPLQ